MRKNSPQHQAPKAPDKPSSPRLTLRFQPIKPKDDRHGESSKSASVSSSEPRYQSYCVTMESREDVYEFKKNENPVSSTQNSSSNPNEVSCDSQMNVVSSSKDIDSTDRGEVPRSVSRKIKVENHVHGQFSSQGDKVKSEPQTGENELKSNPNKMAGEGSSYVRPEYDELVDGEPEEGRRKRRKDSTDSKHSSSSNSSARNHISKDASSNNSSKEEKRTVAEPVSAKGGSGSDTESTQSDIENEANKQCDALNFGDTNSVSHHQMSPKVPPLKIVIPTTTNYEVDKDRCRSNVPKQALPYIVSASADSNDAKSDTSMGGQDANMMIDKDNSKDDLRGSEKSQTEERHQRVTRSSQRMAAAMATAGSSSMHGQNSNDSTTNQFDSKSNSGEGSPEEPVNVDVHPRKRKLRPREGNSSDPSGNPSSSHQEEQPVLNCYEMYLNLKKQVDRRRRNMYVVQPKAPQGFKDYLMNRCSYVLAGNAASTLSVPMIPPPQSLAGPMKDLFLEQEKERYKLRLQHIIEREKMVLSAEQEILRVHGRAARALANQSIPLSVCTVLKDEEIYNQIEPEQLEKVSSNVNMSHHYAPLLVGMYKQEEKERNARSRYNGRLFLSWLQDVDDKWEKLKEAMLLRHHNEAESLHAVQKLDWEWKVKELGACDTKTTPVIDDIHVPMVHVNDEIDLLPA